MSTNNGDGPGVDRTLAHAWGDVHRAAWLVAHRRPGGRQALAEAVEALAQQWAARLQLDDLGRTPAEVEAESAQLAALEALGDGDEDGEPDDASGLNGEKR